MKLFKLLFLLGFIFVFQSAAFCAETTFTVISDTNIKRDSKDNSMTPSIQKLLYAKDDINKSGSKFVIFLGNNVSKADRYDIVMFGKIINKIKRPVYATVGNRDIQRVKDLDKKEYYKVLNKYSKNRISKLPCTKKLDGFLFIFLDGVNETVPMPKGYFKDKELIWLENTLEKNKNQNVILIQHFPAFVGKKENDTLYNPEPYTRLLSKYKNIKAVISGHINKDFEGEDENGIRHISVPSLASAGEYKVVNIKTIDGALGGASGEEILIKTKTISVE